MSRTLSNTSEEPQASAGAPEDFEISLRIAPKLLTAIPASSYDPRIPTQAGIDEDVRPSRPLTFKGLPALLREFDVNDARAGATLDNLYHPDLLNFVSAFARREFHKDETPDLSHFTQMVLQLAKCSKRTAGDVCYNAVRGAIQMQGESRIARQRRSRDLYKKCIRVWTADLTILRSVCNHYSWPGRFPSIDGEFSDLDLVVRYLVDTMHEFSARIAYTNREEQSAALKAEMRAFHGSFGRGARPPRVVPPLDQRENGDIFPRIDI